MKNFFFNFVLKLILGKIAAVAMNAVKTLDNVDLTSEEKRKQAFDDIKNAAEVEGKDLRASLINLAIELCVNLIREAAEKNT